MLRAHPRWVKQISGCGRGSTSSAQAAIISWQAPLFVFLFLGIGGIGGLLGELGDAGIGQANGPVHVVGDGLVEGDVAFAKTVENGAEFE